MPELPEVETVRVGLQKLVVGKQIESINFDWNKSFPISDKDQSNYILGRKVSAVRRRAKLLIIDLDNDYSLIVHLRMTGQLVYRDDKNNFGAGHPNDSLIGVLPDKSTRVQFIFSDQSKLFFNDQRKFGYINLVKSSNLDSIPFVASLGPEPLEESFTFNRFMEYLSRKKHSQIKAALLDQKVISGIGNIYADESLWMSKIHPTTKIENVSNQKLRVLHQSIIDVLRLSISKGGSTDRNYVNAEGKKGSYIEFANVFRKENQPCPRCGHIIRKIRVAGRGTHICPKCQRVSRVK